METNRIYVHRTNRFYYPDVQEYFNPSLQYPEYQFPNSISSTENHVYDIVRTSFYELGLDTQHYGTPDWNPLGDIIEKGNTVLIKPNMVMHVNGIQANGTDCLITHPSLVRAVIDYVIIALNGTGRIILADAPMQSCDFKKLVDEQGYTKIIEFYKNAEVDVELLDLRNVKSAYIDGVLCTIEKNTRNESVVVDLKNHSEFSELDEEKLKNLRITNYEPSTMYEHHNKEKHEYLIAKCALDADVIINMPKPKTHRKAGLTISLKNMVGINTNKEWLPHHTMGSRILKGDEYLNSSVVKQVKSKILDRIYTHSAFGNKRRARLFKIIVRALNLVSKVTSKDYYSEGSWYGNDTIWRTILDLNRILYYADKKGNLKKEKQRKMLIIADMILSGEGEGPLLPKPKNVGVIAASNNPVICDEVLATIMGFDFKRIPSINKTRTSSLNFQLINPNEKYLIKSNNKSWDDKCVDEIITDVFSFEPTTGWKDY